MNILLHICCGPCAIYCVKDLQAKGNSVEGFFYNPNIHPMAEFIKRKEAAEQVSKSLGCTVHFLSDYQFEEFFNMPASPERQERCPRCWQMRLDRTADYARKNGFDGFTSTLLISPYQDHNRIRQIALNISNKYALSFVYEDFRSGFKESHQLSRAMGLYHQNYCGCLYSERERYQRTKEKKKEAYCHKS